MNDDKWEQLVEMAKKNFNNVTVFTEAMTIDTPDGEQQQGKEDVLEFENELGHFQMVRESKPLVINKKMHFSHRQGDTARTEYTISETEFSHKLYVYKQDGLGNWDEVSLDNLGF